MALDLLLDFSQLFVIVCNLNVQTRFSLVSQMAMVLPFNNAFDADGDQQPDRNGKQVKEEVSPAVDRFMRRVDVETQLLAIVTPAQLIGGELYKPFQ